MDKKQFALFVKFVVEHLTYMYEDEYDPRFSRKTSPTEFEKLVVEASEKIICENSFTCTIDYTEGGHAFPDIVYNFDDARFGIEVKSSTSANSPDNSWTILGNSILGSTSIAVDDVHVIYIKANRNGCFINHARYEDAVSDVVVTHSPRYKINLAQDPNDSFFARSGISYEQIKESDDPIGLVTGYFRDQGEIAWWIADSMPATIKTWNEIDEKTRNEILAKAYLLFPELIYSSGSRKYKRLAKWLVANYSVVDSSLRDRFTAGGQVNLIIDNQEFIKLPRICESFYNLIDDFKKQINEMHIEELNKYWETYSPENDDYFHRLDYWRNIIHNHLKQNKETQSQLEFLELLISKIQRP